MTNTIKILKLKKEAILPTRGTKGSAGLDLYACIPEKIVINPQKHVLVPTGIAIELENEFYAGMIYARSGLALKHGITLLNGVGVIDSDYRGEICLELVNVFEKPYSISNGERIGQLVITPIVPARAIEVKSLSQTERGIKGFGSTGK